MAARLHINLIKYLVCKLKILPKYSSFLPMSFTYVFYWNHQRINPFPNFPKAQLKQYFPAWLVKRFGLSESRTRQFESQGAVPRKEQPFDSCQGLHPSAVSKRVKIAHLSIKVLHEGAKPREWEPCQELRQLWPQEGSWVSLAAWRPGRSLLWLRRLSQSCRGCWPCLLSWRTSSQENRLQLSLFTLPLPAL